MRKEESYNMPGTANAMEIGNEQTETGHTMMGGGMGSGRGDEGSGGMPGGGMNGDGSGGSDDGGETPRSRTCATMDMHRQLLSRFPSYAQARDEIENLALRYANNPEVAQRPGVTRIPVVVHVV